MRFVLSLFAILAAFLLLRSLLAPLVSAVVSILSPTPAPPAPRESAAVKPASELKKDPVCGAFISPELAVTEKYQGQTVHFCSKKCRDEFLHTA
jgi:YHS domain-containing protein